MHCIAAFFCDAGSYAQSCLDEGLGDTRMATCVGSDACSAGEASLKDTKLGAMSFTVAPVGLRSSHGELASILRPISEELGSLGSTAKL